MKWKKNQFGGRKRGTASKPSTDACLLGTKVELPALSVGSAANGRETGWIT